MKEGKVTMKKILLPLEETDRSLKALNYAKKHYTPEEAEFVLMMVDERLGYSVKSEVENAALAVDGVLLPIALCAVGAAVLRRRELP